MPPSRDRVHTEDFKLIMENARMSHTSLFSFTYKKAVNKAFSIVGSKKVSKLAVVRNRNKRRVRHAFKKLSPSLPSGSYIVFIKKDLTSVSFADIAEEMQTLLKSVR